MGFYQQGIGAKPTDKTILEALYCNSAACNVELRKFACMLWREHVFEWLTPILSRPQEIMVAHCAIVQRLSPETSSAPKLGIGLLWR